MFLPQMNRSLPDSDVVSLRKARLMSEPTRKPDTAEGKVAILRKRLLRAVVSCVFGSECRGRAGPYPAFASPIPDREQPCPYTQSPSAFGHVPTSKLCV